MRALFSSKKKKGGVSTDPFIVNFRQNLFLCTKFDGYTVHTLLSVSEEFQLGLTKFPQIINIEKS